MLKNLNTNLIDEITDEIWGKKSIDKKLTEVNIFTKKFIDNHLTRKITLRNLKNVVILIDYYNSDLIEEHLLRKGYFVNSFCSQELAESRIRAHKPDIVIIDSLSNKFDGYEVARQTKQLYPQTHLVSIIHSRQIQMIDVDRFTEMFDYFLVMPLTTEKLSMFPVVKRETAKDRLRKKVRLVQNINRLRLPKI